MGTYGIPGVFIAEPAFKTKPHSAHHQFPVQAHNVPINRNLYSAGPMKLNWHDFLHRIDQEYPDILLCPYVCKASYEEVCKIQVCLILHCRV